MVAALHVGKVPPALPSIRQDFGASLGQAGWLLSLVNLTAALGGMAIALTVDRFGHLRLVVVGTALCALASLFGSFAESIQSLLAWRFLEGLAFVIVTVSVPTLVLRVTRPPDRHRAMTAWTSYMPAGAGTMMLVAAVILPLTSWRVVWLVAAGASLAMLVALAWRAFPRRELDEVPSPRRPLLNEMVDVGTSPGPIGIALCFGAYSCCWLAIVGFLPTLQVERLGFAPSTAAIVTAMVTVANVVGNLAAGWLLQRGLSRATVIIGATIPMAFCAGAIFVDGVPDILRLVFAGVYSAVIGVVPGALFTGLPVHSPRPELLGASTGLLMQGSNAGGLIGPPLVGTLVAGGGWPAAAWLTSSALTLVVASAAFLQWRERRRFAG
ncbi:MAG: MFS transporter [Enhydrobacter sp.]|nr:MAG: MFS transporter [Enhydrobacter sp.]